MLVSSLAISSQHASLLTCYKLPICYTFPTCHKLPSCLSLPTSVNLPPPLPQNFTYTWFCRRVGVDQEHPAGADGRLLPYNTHAIPDPSSASSRGGGGCFGYGPGT